MPTRKLSALCGLCVALAIESVASAASFGPVRGHGGAVVSSEAAATAAGLEVLRAGGNAVDAAVATALALAVVHPEAGNLGGGGFAVIRIEGETYTLDFRETAPAAATATMYLNEDGDKIRGSSLVGPLAAGTPGSPHGLWELQRRFGVLEWRRVVEPAIGLASGFTVSDRLARRLARGAESLARFEETARVWLPGGKAPLAGSRMALPDLESTLERYAADGPSAITEGPIAAAIEAAVRAHGGVLAGFLLNNEMDDFTTAPGRENVYGLIQGDANQVRPGRRMLSSMTPTLAWRGTEALALGGRGGPRIPTATMQTLLGVIVDQLDVQRAVNQPRIHHQWLPDLLRWEEGALSPETAAELGRRGHAVSDQAATGGLARVHALHLLRSGEMQAAADPRAPGVAGIVTPLPD